ncbi:gamma carbonic anhydrase family protein [Aliiglaciecola sp. 3_MG-2023]|uniref:gamma carbonic anhydrase family protein n=1 Tax=Aliiglaciecola sp. 3_MG-2023 TaxID=3062644 RepID=UPI0026E3ECF5|nr:gamma carbonic anhydrase family protein [Aliiglaciecola sp. 3_MG-2023]MDO6692512.1 gamma carbonic anhydrase family protein [Aliiglaciecola sp. 3_MG-2023]
MIYSLGERKAVVAESAFIAPGSHVIGSVNLAENSSIWFNVVIRGDCDQITVGPDTNIQDGSVLHTDYDIPLTIGKGVTVGHKVMLHGCEIGDYSLIGINAVVLNGAKIGRYCLIGANSLVTENMEIPDGSLVMGSPAKVVKTLSEKQQAMLKGSAEHYVNNAKHYICNLIKE